MKFSYAGLILTFIFTYTSPVNADAPSIPEDAINCSALFFIMTSLSVEEPKFGQAMTSLSYLMAGIYATHESKATGKRITQGDILRLRDHKAKELGSLYDKNSNAVVNEYLFCSQWRASIAKYFSKQGFQEIAATKNKNEIDKFMLNIPTGPDRNKLNLSNKSYVSQVIDQSFKAWTEMGRITVEDQKKIMKRIIDKK